MIVEAEASLVPDRGWLEDLGENLCHGSPVAAVGRRDPGGPPPRDPAPARPLSRPHAPRAGPAVAPSF